MRLHTKLSTGDMFNIKDKVVSEGLIPSYIHYDALTLHGSRSRDHAFEVKLGSDIKIKGDGRRWTNSGTYGKGGNYAATYDEWGWLIAEIFEQDPEAIFGNYDGRDDFHRQTKYAYATKPIAV